MDNELDNFSDWTYTEDFSQLVPNGDPGPAIYARTPDGFWARVNVKYTREYLEENWDTLKGPLLKEARYALSKIRESAS